MILMMVDRCKSLADLEHELMHVQWLFRLATLMAVPADKLLDDITKNLHELEPSAKSWSTLTFIRKVANSYSSDTKETRIKWIDEETLEFIDPRSGEKTVVSRQNMRDLNNYFATQAEGILDSLDIPVLTSEQLASIVDPLASSSDAVRVSLMHYNDALATLLSASATIVQKDLESLSRLHTYTSVRLFILICWNNH